MRGLLEFRDADVGLEDMEVERRPFDRRIARSSRRNNDTGELLMDTLPILSKTASNDFWPGGSLGCRGKVRDRLPSESEKMNETTLDIAPKLATLDELLYGRLFRIPQYQRTYSWLKRQRQDLFRRHSTDMGRRE